MIAVNASHCHLKRGAASGRMSKASLDGNARDPWMVLLMQDSRSLIIQVDSSDDEDSSLPSTVDQGIQSNVEGSRTRTRSRSRSHKRPLWPSTDLLRRLLEPKPPGPSMADELIDYFEKKIWRYKVPILSHFYEADPADSISSINMHFCVNRFYIGATIDPIRRWLGGTSDTRETDMPGHCQRYHRMWLIGVAENEAGKPAARHLETRLSRFSREKWPDICDNKADDARGQVNGINFMYMVVNDD
jgi:hypothetical protein